MKYPNSIAKKNDEFRNTFGRKHLGRIVVTSGVEDSEDRTEILAKTRSHHTFNKNDDPHLEHDFGAFDVNGTQYFFKFDYYDKTYEVGLEPGDVQCHRVLTIMRADEY